MRSSCKRGLLASNARAANFGLDVCTVSPTMAYARTQFWSRGFAVLLLLLAPTRVPAGIVFLSGDDADDAGHCTGNSCGGLYPAVFSFSVANSASPGTGILAIGVNGMQAGIALTSWNNPVNGGPGAAITIVTNPTAISTVAFTDFDVLYIPSVVEQTPGGLTQTQLDALNTRQADIVDFVNDSGGALIALTQAEMPNAYGWLPIPIQTVDQEHTNVCPTAALTGGLAPTATCANMSHSFYHTVFTGPPGFLGLQVLATSTDAPVGDVVLLGGADVQIGGQITLTPQSAINPTGTSHTLTATVLDLLPPNNPIANTLVTFNVLSGPNVGTTGTNTTNLSGIAMFTYNGLNVAGVDQIQASFVDSNGTQLSNVVTNEWVACLVNVDCNDNNPCTTDSCVNGVCVHAPIPGCCQSNADCDDGIYCNGIETCVNGMCQPGIPPNCDDGNGLTVDCCDEDTDTCIHTPVGGLSISRISIDAGDKTRPVGGGYRLIPNVAESVVSKDAVANTWVSNGQFRLRLGLLVAMPDCNGNGIHDAQDIECGLADCNANGIPDSCEVAVGGDCNGNEIPDSCEPRLTIIAFIDVLIGTDNSPVNQCLADQNGDGSADGLDVQPYVRRLVGG